MMNQNLRPIAAVPVAGTNAVVAPARTSQEIIEARQESQIWTTFALSPCLRANDLKVVVREGKATLTGNVADGVDKDLAKQIALSVDGIKSVDNNIEVPANHMTPAQSEKRTFGEMIDDATITSAVRSKILWSRYADNLSVNVDSTRGQVSLTGTAESAAAKELAGKLATNTQGVRSVANQLTIQSAKTGLASNEGSDFADGWITTKVKSTFMFSTNVGGSDISVSTHDGIVSLGGKVVSGAERAVAIELAGNVRGVKSVNSSSLTM